MPGLGANPAAFSVDIDARYGRDGWPLLVRASRRRAGGILDARCPPGHRLPGAALLRRSRPPARGGPDLAMAARFAPDEWERSAPRSSAGPRELRALRRAARRRGCRRPTAYVHGGTRRTRTWSGSSRSRSELAEVAAEVAELAALVAAEGNPNVTGDAAAGADLAAAAASVGARLVRINASPGDERVREARALAEKAANAARGAGAGKTRNSP